jgi:hypothetical protein
MITLVATNQKGHEKYVPSEKWSITPKQIKKLAEIQKERQKTAPKIKLYLGDKEL